MDKRRSEMNLLDRQTWSSRRAELIWAAFWMRSKRPSIDCPTSEPTLTARRNPLPSPCVVTSSTALAGRRSAVAQIPRSSCSCLGDRSTATTMSTSTYTDDIRVSSTLSVSLHGRAPAIATLVQQHFPHTQVRMRTRVQPQPRAATATQSKMQPRTLPEVTASAKGWGPSGT